MPTASHYATTISRLFAPAALMAAITVSLALSPAGTTPVAQNQHQETAKQQDQKKTDDDKKKSVEDIMRELEEGDPAATTGGNNASDPGELFRTIEGTRGANAPAGGTRKGRAPTTLMPEGTIIVDRAGRMVRSDVGGEWLFTFETDRNGKQDPPMVLLPCRRLERMEKLLEERADATVFRVSGQVYVYYDRNYLLPTWYQIPYERNNISP